MTQKHREEIRVLEKQKELTEAKTEQIKVKGKWDKAIAEAWGMTGVKIGMGVLIGVLGTGVILRVVLIFFNR